MNQTIVTLLRSAIISGIGVVLAALAVGVAHLDPFWGPPLAGLISWAYNALRIWAEKFGIKLMPI